MNSIRNKEERFTYDRLDRLTSVIEGIDTTGVFTYDGYGRMTMKRLHGAMVFDNTAYGADGRPHALERARMYDELPEHSIRYTSFDKILSIQQDEVMLPDYGLLRFEYGYGHQRLRTTEFSSPQDSVVKVYVGSCEFVETNGVTTSECTFLSGPLGVFAVLDSHVQPLGKGIYYVHPDHLGSWTTVTNRNGLVVQDVRFDPWGTPYYSDSTTLTQAASLLFDRGFTGHEHLMRYGLINMNGRVYDPVTSTFLSVDNFVQDPSSTQNFNRYAYCLNNPLKYTDPDGEWAHLVIGALIGGIVNLATNWSKCDGFWEYAAAFGAGAANGALSAAAPGWGSLLGGALSGATNNLISQTGHNFSSTGSFDSSSFWTSVASGAAAGVGGYLGSSVGSLSVGAMNITSPALKSLVGGTVGGASGGFLGGFAGGALSKDSDITSALEAGLSGAISGVAIGGVSGVANGIVDSRANNVNFWTGKSNVAQPPTINTEVNQEMPLSPSQKGKAGVEKASQELIAEGYTLHSTEITVEVNGVRVRLDIAMFKDGNVYLVEVKNGPHAGFTPNQKAAYPQMTDSPNILKAPIIPKGSNAIPVFGAPNIGQPTTNYNLMIIHYY